MTVYYTNDDWAFSSPVTRRQPAAVTRRLGQAGPADLSATPKNVYAVDRDDVYTIVPDDGRGGVPAESDEFPYFLAGSGGSEKPGPVVTHLLRTLRIGRVNADPDPSTGLRGERRRTMTASQSTLRAAGGGTRPMPGRPVPWR